MTDFTRSGPRSVTHAHGYSVRAAFPRYVEYQDGRRALRFGAARPGPGSPYDVVLRAEISRQRWRAPHEAEPVPTDVLRDAIARVTAGLAAIGHSVTWADVDETGEPLAGPRGPPAGVPPARQHAPDVSLSDVERVVRRDFTPDQAQTALAILARYGAERYEREAARVRLAILKQANKDIKALDQLVDFAKGDYRDILLVAEYPHAARARMEWLPDEERRRIYEADRAQYEAWLARC